MPLPLAYQSTSNKISYLKKAISSMKSKGKKTDFLEEQLQKLTLPKSTRVDIFELGNPINKFIYVSEVEAEQMQLFGFVVFDNPEADRQELRSRQSYQIARAQGVNIGF